MGQTQTKLPHRVVQDLRARTSFSGSEIRQWHKEFRKQFPNGRISPGEFKEMYRKQFPGGDPSTFADHVFRSFDTDKNGTIDFREFMLGLNLTMRGTPEEKLTWAFSVFDVNGDGFIEKEEMVEMFTSIYKMLDCSAKAPPAGGHTVPYEEAERLFQQMDVSGDGRVSLEEFLHNAVRSPIMASFIKGKSKPSSSGSSSSA